MKLTKLKKATFFFLATILLLSCEQDNEPLTDLYRNDLCGKPVIISKTVYENTTTDNYTITNVVFDENCLTITISSSGCNGDSWSAELIDLGTSTEPIHTPELRQRLSLLNNETCSTLVEKSFTFNFTNDVRLQGNMYGVFDIRLEGWEDLIRCTF